MEPEDTSPNGSDPREIHSAFSMSNNGVNGRSSSAGNMTPVSTEAHDHEGARQTLGLGVLAPIVLACQSRSWNSVSLQRPARYSSLRKLCICFASPARAGRRSEDLVSFRGVYSCTMSCHLLLR